MHDSEKLLHRLDGFQRELEAVLKQVTRMEQEKSKQAKKQSLLLRMFGFVIFGAADSHSSGAGPERELQELLRKAVSHCEKMRGWLAKSSDLPRSPMRCRVQTNAVNYDDLLRYKQLLQEAYAGEDISTLAKELEHCYSSYQKLLEAAKEYDEATAGRMQASQAGQAPPSQAGPAGPSCPQGQTPFPQAGPTVPPFQACPMPPSDPFVSGIGSTEPPAGSAFGGFQGGEPEAQKPEPLTDDVQFRAVAPASLRRDSYETLKIMMYRGDDYEVADRAARSVAKEIKEDISGVIPVQRYQKLTIRIQSADVQIEEDTQELVWNGRYTCCGFEIFLPSDFPKKQVRIKGRVYQGPAVLTDLRLILDVEGAAYEQAVPVERCTFKSAFLSYSHQDKSQVLAYIRGISLARPDMDLFFDSHSLRRGERYEERIFREIETRDLFYLFWSREASQSPWVNKELEHAIANKDPDRIEPVPLEPPDICPPPQALNDRNFDDWTLRYELELRRKQPPSLASYVLRSADGYEIAIPERGGVVGRDPYRLGADYLSGFQMVSRAHLCIIPQPDGGVFIEDLGSHNGTFLDGQRVDGPICASAGSRITLANVEFSLLKRDQA